MGTFDELVTKTINDIAAARRDRKQHAESVVATAENMFGQIGTFISELQPRLAKEFPAQQPSVSLSGWETTSTAGAANTIKLKRAGAEKGIHLSMTLGEAEVTVNGTKLPSQGIVDVLASEIAHFFKEG